jgi:hypothetical protein
MVQGILASSKSVVWAMLVLGVITYIFAVGIASAIDDSKQYQPETCPDCFTSMPQIMNILFMSITGGIDWINVATPLSKLNPTLTVAFLFYVALSLFAVFNVITGVFVEQASKITAHDEDALVMDELESRQSWNKLFYKLFNTMDVDGSGNISFDGFQKMVQDERAQALFRKIGVDMDEVNVRHVFDMLDFSADGLVNFDEFKSGIFRLRGGAKSIDMAALLVRSEQTARLVAELVRKMDPSADISFAQRGIVSYDISSYGYRTTDSSD